MVGRRMALVSEKEREIAAVETANFVLLSLYRNYSLLCLNDPAAKDGYKRKMQQIKQDLRYLTQKELLTKVEKLYKPLLQKMEGNIYYGK